MVTEYDRVSWVHELASNSTTVGVVDKLPMIARAHGQYVCLNHAAHYAAG